VTLEILREGKPLTIKIEVGTLDTQDQNPDGTPPSTVEPGQAPEAVPPSDPDKPLGLSIKPLSDDERRSAKVVSGGVRVASVSPGAGREAGVLPGDVVLSVAGQEVDSVARFQEVAGRLTPGQTVPMLVQRDGAPLFLALAVPPKP
jgi:serine protease Do